MNQFEKKSESENNDKDDKDSEWDFSIKETVSKKKRKSNIQKRRKENYSGDDTFNLT